MSAKSGKWHLKFMRKHGQCLCLSSSLSPSLSLSVFFFWNLYNGTANTEPALKIQKHLWQNYTKRKRGGGRKVPGREREGKAKYRQEILMWRAAYKALSVCLSVCLSLCLCSPSVHFLTHSFSTFSFSFSWGFGQALLIGRIRMYVLYKSPNCRAETGLHEIILCENW